MLRAIKAGDAEHARQIMRDHMIAAQAYMERVEAELRPRFLRVRRERQG